MCVIFIFVASKLIIEIFLLYQNTAFMTCYVVSAKAFDLSLGGPAAHMSFHLFSHN